MTNEIIQALSNELRLLLNPLNIYVIRDTQFKDEEHPAHLMPCVVLSFSDSPDLNQFIGGSLQIDWDITLKAFIYDFNTELSDDQNYSTNEYDIIEKLTYHFAKKNWISNEMKALETDRYFNMALSGAVARQSMTHKDGGIIVGFGLQYYTKSVTNETNWNNWISADTLKIKGGALLDYDLKSFKWLKEVNQSLTESEFNSLTSQTVGLRYFITDLNKIYEVSEIDVNGSITQYETTILIKDNLFYDLQNIEKLLYFDGAEIQDLNSISAIIS